MHASSAQGAPSAQPHGRSSAPRSEPLDTQKTTNNARSREVRRTGVRFRRLVRPAAGRRASERGKSGGCGRPEPACDSTRPRPSTRTHARTRRSCAQGRRLREHARFRFGPRQTPDAARAEHHRQASRRRCVQAHRPRGDYAAKRLQESVHRGNLGELARRQRACPAGRSSSACWRARRTGTDAHSCTGISRGHGRRVAVVGRAHRRQGRAQHHPAGAAETSHRSLGGNRNCKRSGSGSCPARGTTAVPAAGSARRRSPRSSRDARAPRTP